MPKNERVVVVAAGITKFGTRKATFRDLISEAGKATFDNNENIAPLDIKSFILATCAPERYAFQGHPATLACEQLGIYPDTLYQRVENQCGTGTIGIRTGYMAIMAGITDLVMVVGAEKMMLPKDVHQEIFLTGLGGCDREWESCFGILPPAVFSLSAKMHMKKFGTTEEQMALVAVKNHTHATRNPYATFTKGATLEAVMSSRPVAPPLKLYDCCPNADGAAGVILASEERAKDLTDKPVYILGSSQTARGYTAANLNRDWAEWPVLRLAAKKAYEDAKVTADDIDLAEIHDCFTVSEIIQYEEFGFCKKGEGGKFIEEGRSDYGGEVVVNPRGGLLACGHPLGATGVAQAHELFLQLRGEAGKRQVDGAKIGLAHTMSQFCGAENHIIIYGKE